MDGVNSRSLSNEEESSEDSTDRHEDSTWERGATSEEDIVSVHLLSFGHRYGPPTEAMRKVWNCAHIANPSTCSRKGRTGMDKRLRREVMQDITATSIVEDALELIRTDVANAKNGESLWYGFRCEIGVHRSVSVAENARERLRKECKEVGGAYVVVSHRDVQRVCEGHVKGSRRQG